MDPSPVSHAPRGDVSSLPTPAIDGHEARGAGELPRAAAAGELGDVVDRARGFVRLARDASTWRAYRADWRDFEAWCASHALDPLPAAPATVALYLAALADWAKASTLQRRLSSISAAHGAAGFPTPTSSPEVKAVWSGIRRAKGMAPARKAPATTPTIRAMVEGLPDTLLGIRDRALILVGYAGAFRRSELVALDVADLELREEGLALTLRRSKTDQEGEGRKVGIPFGSTPATCPVRALKAWLAASAIAEGPIFRSVHRHGQLQPGRLSGRAVALVVKRRVLAIGLDPIDYAGHSLRAGLATAAAAAGAPEAAIARQTGHKSMTVLRGYIRDGELFRHNAAAAVGL